MRIRWRGVARVAAVVVVGLLALRLLPGLLRAPEPPPPATDVGLPRAEPVTEAPHHPAATPVPEVAARRKAKRATARDTPAAVAVIGTHRRHRQAGAGAHRPKPAAEPAAPAPESAPPPVPEYVPPAPSEPVAEAVPELPPAPPSAPGDGSEEFAPH